MTGRTYTDASSTHHTYQWNEDNRLVRVERDSQGLGAYEVFYRYDTEGRRLLRTEDGVRNRYFFRGLTEEHAKQSVPNAHADDAFRMIGALSDSCR